MTLAAFNGHEALTFTDYMDLETGKTLHAEPGGTYDVAPASGRNVPDIPEGWFTPVQFATGVPVEDAGALAEGDSTPEPGSEEEADAEPAPGEDPETGEPQQF